MLLRLIQTLIAVPLAMTVVCSNLPAQVPGGVETGALMVYPMVDQVLAYDLDGNLVWMTPRTGLLAPTSTRPNSVAVDPVRDMVWVGVTGILSGTNRLGTYMGVERYRLSDGMVIDSFAIPMTPGFTRGVVTGMEVDREGSCYLSIDQWGGTGPEGSDWIGLKLDRRGATVWRRNYTSELWLDPDCSGGFRGLPGAVRVAPDGTVWFVAWPPSVYCGGGRAVRVDPQGGSILFSTPSGSRDVSFSPTGEVRLMGQNRAVGRTVSLTEGGRNWHVFDANGNYLRGRDGLGSYILIISYRQHSHVSGHILLTQLGCGLTVIDMEDPQRNSRPINTNHTAQTYEVLNPRGREWGYRPLTTPRLLGADFNGTGSCQGGTNIEEGFDVRGRFWSFSDVRGSLSGVLPGTLQKVVEVTDPDPLTQVDPVTGVATLRPYVWRTALPGTPSASSQIPIFGNYGSYEWCLVTDQMGDLDGDGTLNLNEFFEGTSPGEQASRGLSAEFFDWRPGRTARIELEATGQPNRPYVTVMELAGMGAIQPLRLPDGRFIGPSITGPLAQLWLSAPLTASANTIGNLDGQGRATVQLPIPADPSLNGLLLEFGAVTADPNWSDGLRSIHGPLRIQLGNL